MSIVSGLQGSCIKAIPTEGVRGWATENKTVMVALGILAGIAVGVGIAAAIGFSGGIAVIPIAALYAIGASVGGVSGGLAVALLVFKKKAPLEGVAKAIPTSPPIAEATTEQPAARISEVASSVSTEPRGPSKTAPLHSIKPAPPLPQAISVALSSASRDIPKHSGDIPARSPYLRKFKGAKDVYSTDKELHFQDLYWCLKTVNEWFKTATDACITDPQTHFDWFAFPWGASSEVYDARFMLTWPEAKAFIQKYPDAAKMIAENADRVIVAYEKTGRAPNAIRQQKIHESLQMFGDQDNDLEFSPADIEGYGIAACRKVWRRLNAHWDSRNRCWKP